MFGLIPESGFAAVMVALLVLSGTQLVVSGLIGEYLWRVLEESRNRPTFLVAQTANVDLLHDGVGPMAGYAGTAALATELIAAPSAGQQRSADSRMHVAPPSSPAPTDVSEGVGPR